MASVRVKFLGSKFVKGVPKVKRIKIEDHIFWNYIKHEGVQDAEGFQRIDRGLYDRHDVFKDKTKFAVSFAS